MPDNTSRAATASTFHHLVSNYLLKQHGFDLKQSALLAGTPLMVGAFGSLFAGWFSPHLARWLRDVGRARRFIGAAGCVGAVGLFDRGGATHAPYLAVAAIAFVAFCNDVQMPRVDGLHGRRRQGVGTLSGTMNMMGNFGGFISPVFVVTSSSAPVTGVSSSTLPPRCMCSASSSGWPWTR